MPPPANDPGLVMLGFAPVCLYQTSAKLALRGLGATLLMKRARNKGTAVWKLKRTEKRKKNEAREDMETGDTSRSGILAGTAPESRTIAKKI